jgi:hypothetical protein
MKKRRLNEDYDQLLEQIESRRLQVSAVDDRLLEEQEQRAGDEESGAQVGGALGRAAEEAARDPLLEEHRNN